VPKFREDISALTPYEVGRPVEEAAREHGLNPDSIVKLAANESPEGPFPGAVEAAAAALTGANRYPDNDLWDLSGALASELGADRSNLLFGNGSVALITDIANAAAGPGANVVYGWPSFIMYRFATVWSGADRVEAPLRRDHSLDLDAIAAAVDHDTRAVFICNPNNPTGTITAADEIEALIAYVPDSTLVVVDEAYHEYVSDERYRTAVPIALEKPNVIVLRTFSKIYSLAALRIGYAVGRPETLTEVRKAQQPLTVNQPAQAAALASLGRHDEITRRVEANAIARGGLLVALAVRGLPHAESHANFIFFRLGDRLGGDSRAAASELMKRGAIIRPMSSGWARVTVGAEAENRRFVEALDETSESTGGVRRARPWLDTT